MTATAQVLPVGCETRPVVRAARSGLRARGWDRYLIAAVALVPVVVPAGPAQTSILDAMNVGALAWFAWLVVRDRRDVALPFAGPVLLVAIGSVLATASAVSLPAALLTMLQDAYLYCWFVLLVALLARRASRGDLESVRRAWVWTANVIALGAIGVALVASHAGLGAVLFGSRFRASATFYNPNMFADYLILSVFMLLGLIGRMRRALWCGSLAVLLGALVLTKSNGGLIALATGVLVWAVIWAWGDPRSRLRVAGLGALGLALVLLATWAHLEWGFGAGAIRGLEQQSFIGRMSHSSESRGRIWQRLERTWQHAPAGIGPGNSAVQLVSIGARERAASFQAKEAHSDYLGYAVERGPLALAGLAWAMAQAFRMVLRSRRRLTQRTGDRDAAARLRAALAGALVATSVHSLVIEKLHFRHFWLFLALLFVLCGTRPLRRTMRLPLRRRIALEPGQVAP